jgi:hypothetical protein
MYVTICVIPNVSVCKVYTNYHLPSSYDLSPIPSFLKVTIKELSKKQKLLNMWGSCISHT